MCYILFKNLPCNIIPTDPSNNVIDRGGEVRIPAGGGNTGPICEANGDAVVSKSDNGLEPSTNNKNVENSTNLIENSTNLIENSTNSANNPGSDNDSNSIRTNLLNNTNSASNAS